MPLIDPALQNPRFGKALRLKDAGPRTQFVAVGKWGDIRVIELVGKWYLTADHKITASTVNSGLIDLVDYGVHPHPLTGRWNDQYFAVNVEGESIRTLHMWLRDRYLIEDAIRLKKLFSELFATEEDWQRLLAQS